MGPFQVSKAYIRYLRFSDLPIHVSYSVTPFSSLAWLLNNCTEVFHYLALVLKNISNYTCKTPAPSSSKMGAIYNDFDFDTTLLMDDDENVIDYLQVSNLNEAREQDDAVEQEVVEQAILDADDLWWYTMQ